jgi:proline iminopeptidase
MKPSTYFITSLFTLCLLFSGCEQELIVNEPGNLVPKTVDIDSRLPSIGVNGVQLHSEAFGSPNDPMLVVLHGGPGFDYRSLLNCKEFASQGFFVVFYDQRGAGLSERVPYSSFQMDEMYDDLRAVIAHYRSSLTQKVFLLGHSWGAMLATAYINRYPSAIAGAILAEPGGLKWQDVKDYIKRTRQLDLLGEGLNDALYMEQFITGNENEHVTLDYKFGLLSTTSESVDSPTGNGRSSRWRCGSATFYAYLNLGDKIQPDWTTHLDQYTTKVFFIYSEHNTVYQLEHALNVSSPYPRVQLFEALGAGHDMLATATGWKNTFPAMLDYLTSLK